MTNSDRPTLDELPDVIAVSTVASFLGVAENSVYTSIRRGELPAVRLGRRLLVSKTALVHWLQGDDTDGRVYGSQAS